MEPLWEEKENYTRFDPAKHRIARVCGGKHNGFIPYCRKYGTLDQSQLLELIACAKSNRWQALDLTRCGLSELPDELWDLPDLRMLYLGNISFHADLKSNEIHPPKDNHITVLPRGIERLENL